MRISLINKSTLLSNKDLSIILPSIQTQISEHYVPMWQSGSVELSILEDLDADSCPILILDSSDQEGALGYHATIQGRPYGKVFGQTIKDSGGSIYSGPNSLSVTISHEVLETIGDPYANWWVDVDGNTEEALELCDRVEGDAYQIGDVYVSDFLGPRAFGKGPGPYDYMNLLNYASEIRSTGYAILRTGGPGGKIESKFGNRYAKLPGFRRSLRC